MAKKLKTVSAKKHEQIVAELTQRAEEAEASLASTQHNASYWKRAHDDVREELGLVKSKIGHDAGKVQERNGILQTAVIRAHRELSMVKANEATVASLQRIIGSVQGGLGVALEQGGNLCGGLINLYPEDQDASRRLDAIRNTVNHSGRY